LISLPQHRLDALLSRHSLVESELSTNLARDEFVKLSREFSELGPVIDAIKAYRAVTAEIADLDALIADPATDAEMRKMVDAEKPALMAKRDRLEHQIRLALIPKDAMDDHDAILEIRAGTGGDEAALFAGDLFRMYERYAATQGWKTEVLSLSEGTKGGLKEVIAEVHGRGVFAKMKFESGVHRVQRVPDTEASGRIHTSAATVAVLPEVEDVDIDIDPIDETNTRVNVPALVARFRRHGKWKTSISRSPTMISRSTLCARKARAASTSTRPNPPSVSPICRAASSCSSRRSARSIRTKPRR